MIFRGKVTLLIGNKTVANGTGRCTYRSNCSSTPLLAPEPSKARMHQYEIFSGKYKNKKSKNRSQK